MKNTASIVLKSFSPEEIENIKQSIKHDPNVDLNFRQILLETEIIEVLTYRNDWAGVISKSKIPQDKNFYNIEICWKTKGVWKPMLTSGIRGEYPSVEAARSKIDSIKDGSYKYFMQMKDEDAGKPNVESAQRLAENKFSKDISEEKDVVSGKMKPSRGQTLNLEYPELQKRLPEEIEVFKALVEKTDHTFKSAERYTAWEQRVVRM